MTKSDWLAVDEPIDMLAFLGDRLTQRKERLFAAACHGRSVLDSPTGSVETDVETLVRYADGRASKEEVRKLGGGTAWLMSRQRGLIADYAQDSARCSAGSQSVADLIRDLFNPFYQGTLDPDWLTWNDGAVRRMAELIYDGRRFENLPSLADALEDGGCTDSDILNHCRQPGAHAPGCWVIDLLLGKE